MLALAVTALRYTLCYVITLRYTCYDIHMPYADAIKMPYFAIIRAFHFSLLLFTLPAICCHYYATAKVLMLFFATLRFFIFFRYAYFLRLRAMLFATPLLPLLLLILLYAMICYFFATLFADIIDSLRFLRY